MIDFSLGSRMLMPGSVLAITVLVAGSVLAQDEPGAVYAMTNAAADNSVLILNRAAGGALTSAGSISTGGNGTGSGLGSQGALALTSDQRWLLAVNAGSNSITVFSVTTAGLEFRSKTPSGGTTPISMTIHGRLLYVLNAGTPNISGFRLASDGRLTAISTQLINGATGPAQVSFNAGGTSSSSRTNPRIRSSRFK